MFFVKFCLCCRKCKEKRVKAPSWYFASDNKTLIITGFGIKNLKEDIEKSLANNVFDLQFNIRYVDSPVVTELLSGEIVAQIDGRQHRQSSSCEVVIQVLGQEIENSFAVTSAHGFMSQQTLQDLDTDATITTEQQQQMLANEQHRFSSGSLTGQLKRNSQLQLQLNTGPLLGYNTYFNHQSKFMSDIALLEVDPRQAEEIEASVPILNHCRLNGLVHVSSHHPANEASNYIVRSKDRIARVVAERSSPSNTQLGHHLAFELESG